MQTLWFITNPGSGSSTAKKREAIEAAFTARHLIVAGRTNFPEDDLPEPAALDAARVDTVVLFAGDGTINAAVGALAQWGGHILILPGGTMNLLAKALHGDADPATIIAAAHDETRLTALPLVEAGRHRAYVGLIVGPAASWVRARELVRAGRLRGLARAVSHAWRRTFGGGIRLAGVPALGDKLQAVFVRPEAKGLRFAGVDARDWSSIGQLGWGWMTGDWVAAASVTEVMAPRAAIGGRKPVLALFDGEPEMLDPGTEILPGKTAEQFITTAG